MAKIKKLINMQVSCTPLRDFQQIGVDKMYAKPAYALLMEQGTGKTLTFLEEAMLLYKAGAINRVFIIAPNGVHENWILDQVPQHVPDSIAYLAAYYTSGMNQRERRDWANFRKGAAQGNYFNIASMSYDSLLTAEGWDAAVDFMTADRRGPYLVADESHKIKTKRSRRTVRATNLRKMAKYRRIGTGTPATNSPIDIWSQFNFLDPDILGGSLVAFRAEYCQLLPPGHGMMRHIMDRMRRTDGKQMSDREKAARAPAIVAKDDRGLPIYRNLDQLQARIAPYSYRVLKEDCLDLPPKVYETRYFHLNKQQRVAYDRMEEEQRYILEDGTLSITSKLVALSKLRQLTSGFILFRDGSVHYTEDNARIDLLRDTLEDDPRQCIIWAQYKEEIRNIVKLLGKKAAAVNGDTPMQNRRHIREEFQAGNLQYIVAHPGAMGTGFTLTAAELVIYYSNDFNLENRLQSEDRAHRIGQDKTVVYLDLVAIDTRDDDVVWALQHKLGMAELINGDPVRRARFN